MGASAVTEGAEYTPEPNSERPERERDLVVARSDEVGDVSPHTGGRAQPGDVIGIETGGERTGIGDTSEDENKRRQDAENAAEKH